MDDRQQAEISMATDPHEQPTVTRLVRRLEEEIEYTKDNHIKANGWQVSCDAPGSLWYWYREYKGVRWTCWDLDSAYRFQRRIDADNSISRDD